MPKGGMSEASIDPEELSEGLSAVEEAAEGEASVVAPVDGSVAAGVAEVIVMKVLGTSSPL